MKKYIKQTKGKVSEIVLEIILIGTLLIAPTSFISCSKESTEPDNKLIDIDNNVYNTLVIGNQTWMVEDLKTTRYNDGTLIVTNQPDTYTFYMVSTGNLCPINWHVPKDWEWHVLIDYYTRNTTPVFANLGYWWSASTLVEGYESPQARAFYKNETTSAIKEIISLKEQYYSVRCIKDLSAP